MKEKIIKLVLSFIIMGFLQGFILFYFSENISFSTCLGYGASFGALWGLAEIFIFDKIRALSKKRNNDRSAS